MSARVVRVGACCDLYTEEDLVAYLSAQPETPTPRTSGWAALGPENIEEALEHHRNGLSFNVAEFVELADGRRVILHNDRGFTLGPLRTVGAIPLRESHWAQLTRSQLEDAVLSVVLPDGEDDAAGEAHPWQWLGELAASQGVEVTAADLRAVPYVVEFSGRVLERLEPTAD